jgi:hypothetical protein
MTEPEILDLRQTSMRRLYQAYRLMQEGGGHLVMRAASEEDYEFEVRFCAPRALVLLMPDGGEQVLHVGESATTHFRFHMDREDPTAKWDARWKL